MMRDIVERYKLDRRRVEAAHMQYAILQVISWYPALFSAREVLLHTDTDETLTGVVSLYHGAFMAHNASKANCASLSYIYEFLKLYTYSDSYY